ncbi:MAG TPA: response regulator [Polyangiaceae bacterium]|jgi:CheY-like chemotaxis protein/anti-sigma regulatory factor (Ser/Thr protein kinase)|nr:response regulator [Polyangiaceae bacterium]
MTHRVLLIDDDFASLGLLSRVLEPLDVQLSFASSMRPAFALLETEGQRYDLILLERDLHEQDGLEVLRALKRDGRFSDIPVIMQTATAAPEQVSQGLEVGAAYYVAKPIQQDLLCALVRSALSDAADRNSLGPRERATCPELVTSEEAEFQFRTLADARELAALLSGLCPNAERVALGLTELMVNAIEHGNLGISYAEKSALCRANAWQSEVERRLALPEYQQRSAHVQVSRTARALQFVVRDEGAGFRWREFLGIDPIRAFAPNGRGIALARELAFTRLEYRDPGNVVIARVALEHES